MNKKDLQKLLDGTKEKIEKARSVDEIEKLKIEVLGRKEGKLTLVMKGLKDLSPEEKKKIGPIANQVKIEITNLIKEKESYLVLAQNDVKDFDVTLPGEKFGLGHAHPIFKVRKDLEDIFTSLGFDIYEGDNLVSDYYNFESLNIPKDHPARDMQDTFFIACHKDKVMRTHTSSMQVKIMEENEPPLKVIVPGRVFRNEATDASHEHTFYQLEGFVVDKSISIANLIDTQKTLLSQIFKREVKIRLRPGYFPFVEPGFELDFQCLICGGKGCATCKHEGWVEMMGCGMIHPKVFEHAGYLAGKYTGFAFGLGLTRLAMMKYGIDDIRLFMSGDLRFLKQF
ncbi:phenylalanine--tRNA ligase subunit alpha [Patescibacteria group bacterium]|nr:phenylalanine--tRNA ligase subunit alpha [Patescibacteria group bacterium]